MLNQKNLSKTIRRLRDLYVEEGLAISYPDINNGSCREFAEDIVDVFKGETATFYLVSVDDYADETPIEGQEHLTTFRWDRDLVLPSGLSHDDLDRTLQGYHVWIMFNNRHYDATSPDGVDHFVDLPFFRERLRRI